MTRRVIRYRMLLMTAPLGRTHAIAEIERAANGGSATLWNPEASFKLKYCTGTGKSIRKIIYPKFNQSHIARQECQRFRAKDFERNSKGGADEAAPIPPIACVPSSHCWTQCSIAVHPWTICFCCSSISLCQVMILLSSGRCHTPVCIPYSW